MTDSLALSPSRPRLAAEFATLFLGVPLVMAFALPPNWMWAALSLLTVVGLTLLYRTPGFAIDRLIDRFFHVEWRALAVMMVGTAIVCAALVLWLRPSMWLSLPAYRPELWLLIMVFYPFLSVLPQELVYRALFFERYGALFPDRRVAIVVNAAVFSLAHLFYMNWVAVALTAVGGAVFAWAYVEQRSFGFACVLHALAGQIVFTTGLGIFFYHGAIPH